MRLSRSLLVACLSAFVVVGLAVPVVSAGRSTPTTRYVDDDGRGSLNGCSGQATIASSIQSAVDLSTSGDRILVCPGVYVGTVTISNLGGLSIRAVDMWKAIVRPATDHSNNSPLLLAVNSPGTEISRLRLEARTTLPCDNVGAMIAINNSAGALVADNRVTASGSDSLGACGYDTGVSMYSSPNSIVERNFVVNFQQYGLDVYESSNAKLRDNRIQFFHSQSGSTAATGVGILLNSGATGVRVMRNRIRALTSAGTTSPRLELGIALNSTPAIVRDNELRYVDEAVRLLSVTGGARVRSNTAVESVGFGVRLYYSDDNLIADNTLAAGSRSLWAESDSTGNTFSGNDADGPADPDCEDQSSGTGTALTGNIWTGNSGTSAPVGICVPATGT